MRPSPESLLTSIFVLIGVVWGGFLGARQLAGTESFLDRLENLTLDWRFMLRGVQAAPRGVVIAAIDDETARAQGYPLPRFAVAQIIRGLATHEPQAIALDLLILDPGNPEMDVELAEALRSTSSVVAAVGVFESSPADRAAQVQSGHLAGVPIASSIVWPIPALRDAARAGLVNLATDHSGVPRFVPMIYQAADTIVPSFALAAPSVALKTEPVLGIDTLRLAARTVSTDLGYHLPIRYYGPRGSIRHFSAARALRGDLDPNDVRGQVVLVGATAGTLGDTFATPFDRVFPGVEIFATAVSNVLAGDGLVRTSPIRKIDALAAIVLPVVTVVLMAMRRGRTPASGTAMGTGGASPPISCSATRSALSARPPFSRQGARLTRRRFSTRSRSSTSGAFRTTGTNGWRPPEHQQSQEAARSCSRNSASHTKPPRAAQASCSASGNI